MTTKTRINSRFSAAEFERHGKDTEASRKLADLLAKEIKDEVHTAIYETVKKIISKLNNMGHNLTLVQSPRVGDIEYHDVSGMEGEYGCKLRVGVHMHVTTGYAHVTYLVPSAEFDDKKLDD